MAASSSSVASHWRVHVQRVSSSTGPTVSRIFSKGHKLTVSGFMYTTGAIVTDPIYSSQSGTLRQDSDEISAMSTMIASEALRPHTSQGPSENPPNPVILKQDEPFPEQPPTATSTSQSGVSYDYSSSDTMTRGSLGNSIFRWTCCKCGADNSAEYDVGCTNCGDHWKAGCCDVWMGYSQTK
jgi:hypothetical protein